MSNQVEESHRSGDRTTAIVDAEPSHNLLSQELIIPNIKNKAPKMLLVYINVAT